MMKRFTGEQERLIARLSETDLDSLVGNTSLAEIGVYTMLGYQVMYCSRMGKRSTFLGSAFLVSSNGSCKYKPRENLFFCDSHNKPRMFEPLSTSMDIERLTKERGVPVDVFIWFDNSLEDGQSILVSQDDLVSRIEELYGTEIDSELYEKLAGSLSLVTPIKIGQYPCLTYDSIRKMHAYISMIIGSEIQKELSNHYSQA